MNKKYIIMLALIVLTACKEPTKNIGDNKNQGFTKHQIAKGLQQKVEQAFRDAKALKKSYSAWYNRDEKLPLTIVTTAYIDNQILSTKEYQAYKKLIKKIEKDITLLDSLSGKKISNKYSSIKFVDYDESGKHQSRFNASYNHRYDDKEILTDILRPQKEKPSQELLIRVNYKELIKGNLTIEGYKTVKQKKKKRNSYYYTIRKSGYDKLSQKEKNKAIIDSLIATLQLSIPEYVSIDRKKLVKDGDIIRFIKPNSDNSYTGEIWKYEADNEISEVQRKIEALIPYEPIKSFKVESLSATSMTPNNKYLLIGNAFRILSIIDTETGKRINTFQDKSNKNSDIYISETAISPDGEFALIAKTNLYDKKDNTLDYWNLKTGKKIRILSKQSSYISSIAISPDGKYALSGNKDGIIKYWELNSGKMIKVLKGHDNTIISICISADGKYALSGSSTLRYWDLKSGKTIKTLKGHTKHITSVAISKNGKYALSGSDDETLRYWDLNNGKTIKTLKGHTQEINSIAISPDGNYALSVGKILIYWNLKSGKILKKYKNLKFFHGNNIINFSDNGKQAIFVTTESADNGRIYKLELDTPEKMKKRVLLEKKVEDIKRKRIFSEIGTKQLITTTNLNHKDINILKNNNYINTNKLSFTTIEKLLRTLNFSILDPIVNRFFPIYRNYTKTDMQLFKKTILFNSKKYIEDELYFSSYFSFKGNSYKQIEQIENISSEEKRGSKILQKNLFHLASIKITSNGEQAIFLSSEDEYGFPERMPRYLDIKTNKIFKSLDIKENGLRSLEISSNGKHLFARGEKELIYYNLEDGDRMNLLETDKGSIESVSISPDGKHGLSAGEDGLKYWNLETKKVSKHINNSKGIISVKITDDGQHALINELGTIQYYDLNSGKKIKEFNIGYKLVVVNLNKKYALYTQNHGLIKYWDLKKRKVTKILKGHTDKINSIVLSRDGNYAISASDDNTLRYWDLKTGETIKVLKGHTNTVDTVAISPDGNYAISGSYDQTLRYWNLKFELMNKNY